MSDDTPRADQVPGAPHPRETALLLGQARAEAEFIAAFGAGRLHHAWLLTGPRGTGKATLAYRIARFLLSMPEGESMFGPPASLDVPPDHPVSQRIRAESDPGLRLVRRGFDPERKRLRKEISVHDIRALLSFFHLSATDGGRRVVIMDCADDMNRAAANALLKALEEPPDRATLLLVSHQPSRLLATIRSRCRSLRLAPLGPEDMARALTGAGAEGVEGAAGALTELAAGSVGDALRLLQLRGVQIYSEIMDILASLPQLDRGRAIALAASVAAPGKEEERALLVDLLEVALVRLSRCGALGHAPPEAVRGEAATLMRLAPDARAARLWAERGSAFLGRLRQGLAVNLDVEALVLDTLVRLGDTAGDLSVRNPA